MDKMLVIFAGRTPVFNVEVKNICLAGKAALQMDCYENGDKYPSLGIAKSGSTVQQNYRFWKPNRM